MNYLAFLTVLDDWVQKESSIQAAAIVGSYARQTQNPDSDVDIALLVQTPSQYLTNLAWLTEQFPSATNVSQETWGPVGAVRFWLDDLEVELNFSPMHWAQIPVDPGTANVVAGGMTLVKDNNHILQALVDAVAEGDIVNLRTHVEADPAKLAHIFYKAVHALPDTFYSQKQKDAWAPTVDNLVLERWQKRVETKRPFVAEYKDNVVGFIELEIDGQIDCFYVHPEYQAFGIGGMLYQQALNEARGFGIKQLSVDASLAAKPFFEKRGFVIEQENSVQVLDQQLTNFTMTKPI
jgi:putative acetyltransferase